MKQSSEGALCEEEEAASPRDLLYMGLLLVSLVVDLTLIQIQNFRLLSCPFDIAWTRRPQREVGFGS